MKSNFAELIKKHNVTGEGYRINESYRPIADALQKKYEELEAAPIKNILFVDDMETKKKKNGQSIFAEISKIPTKWQEIIMQTTGFYFEYTLTVYRENTLHMSRSQIIALIYHELKHLQANADGVVNIVGHDIEDWREMYYKLGSDWATTQSNVPNLLDADIDWEKIEGPPSLFSLEEIEPYLRVVK